MIFKYNFIKFYYSAFQYISKKDIFNIFFGKPINEKLIDYFKILIQRRIFFLGKVFSLFFLKKFR